MRLLEVKTSADARLFLDVPLTIYKDDPNWIRPLDKDVEEVFDPGKNKTFRAQAEVIRWVLLDDAGKAIGRMAAFVNPKYKAEQPTGGFGFFECIDDASASAMLFDAGKEWLIARGMEAADGPINFGERDRWWGLQVEGFSPPLYCMNYNRPYYQKLFEAYGFQPYFHQICFSLDPKARLQDKFYVRHKEVAADPKFKAHPIRKSELDRYAGDFAIVYNAAWAGHGGGKSLEERTVRTMFRKMKPVMDEQIIWFAYYDGKPIAMWVNLPDLNQWFKHLNGKFGILQKLRFLLLKQFGNCDRFVGLVFGVVPEFQGKGIDAYLIVEAAKVVQRDLNYKTYEMQWIGDFNPKMINIAENLGTYRSRKLTTYRYLFDRTKEFQRHPMLG
jgi:GNAT superfamily N-acetyltransferase